MTQPHGSPLDEHGQAIREWVKDGRNNHEIAELLERTFGLKCSEAAVRRAKKRMKLVSPVVPKAGPSDTDPSFETDGENAVADSGRTAKKLNEGDLRRVHKLTEDDWESYKTVAGQWGDPENPNYQIKVWFRRKVQPDLIVPARIPGEYIAPPRKVRKSLHMLPQLWVVAGDEQAIFHHRLLDDLVNEFIAETKPWGYVGTGDLTDQNAVSRHKANTHTRWNSPLQLDVNEGGGILRRRRQAHEDMLAYWMPGNHDIRLGSMIQQLVPAAHGLTAAQWDTMDEQKELMGLPNVLRLDEIGFEYVDPEGEYEHAQFKIGDHVAVRHGSRTGQNPALKTVDRLTHSVIIGHTHGQSIQNRTIWDIERNHRVIQAVETGALCDFAQVVRDEQRQKGQGLGYAVDPNWVNGFVTVTLWPNGDHNIEAAQLRGDTLIWRGQRVA